MKGTLRNAGIIGGIVLLAFIVGLIIAGIFNVLLAVLYVFLIYAVFTLIQAITTVRNEVKPLLASVQETVGIVKDTAKSAGQTASTIGSTARLTSEFALGPSVRAVAALVAVQQMFRVFMGKGRTRSRAEERRRQQW